MAESQKIKESKEGTSADTVETQPMTESQVREVYKKVLDDSQQAELIGHGAEASLTEGSRKMSEGEEAEEECQTDDDLVEPVVTHASYAYENIEETTSPGISPKAMEGTGEVSRGSKSPAPEEPPQEQKQRELLEFPPGWSEDEDPAPKGEVDKANPKTGDEHVMDVEESGDEKKDEKGGPTSKGTYKEQKNCTRLY